MTTTPRNVIPSSFSIRKQWIKNRTTEFHLKTEYLTFMRIVCRVTSFVVCRKFCCPNIPEKQQLLVPYTFRKAEKFSLPPPLSSQLSHVRHRWPLLASEQRPREPDREAELDSATVPQEPQPDTADTTMGDLYLLDPACTLTKTIKESFEVRTRSGSVSRYRIQQ